MSYGLPRPALSAFALATAMLLVGLGVPASTLRAQALAPTLPELDQSALALDADTRVLPVWSNASGRVEALLLLDDHDGDLPSTALDRLLGPQSGIGFGARVNLDSGTRLQGSLQFDSDAGLALLCDGSPGLTGSLGALGERCLLADLGDTDPLREAIARRVGIDAGWKSADGGIDLDFGLSWMQAELPSVVPVTPTLVVPTPAASPLDGLGPLALLAPSLADVDRRSLLVDGRFALGAESRLFVGGEIGRSRVRALDGSSLRWNSAALSVGLGVGDVVGRITGRLVELPGGGRFNGLDIGVSWRTPWSAQLSIGARNVLGSGDVSRWPLNELPALEDAEARVPYVRYQQDL